MRQCSSVPKLYNSVLRTRGISRSIRRKPVHTIALFGRGKRSVDTGTSHAAQQLRIQTLNRYGINSYDFGTRYLQQGCVGDDVAALQSYLREEGLMRGEDAYAGYFGEATEAAVIKWQQRNHLPATGAFGDLARETYLQKQELRLQDTIGAQSKVPEEEVAVLQQMEPAVAAPMVEEAGNEGLSGPLRLAVGLVLAVAALVGYSAFKAWLTRKQSSESFPASWQGDLHSLKAQWGIGGTQQEESGAAEGSAASSSPVIVNSLFSVPDPIPQDPPTQYAVQSPHGTYFNPGSHEMLRKELAQRSNEENGSHAGGFEASPINGSNGSRYEQAPAPTRSVRLTDQRRASTTAKAPVAEPGSYFGGAVRRPYFEPLKNGMKQEPKMSSKKPDILHEEEGGSRVGWDAWTASRPEDGVGGDKEIVEPLADNWATTSAPVPLTTSQSTNAPFPALKPYTPESNEGVSAVDRAASTIHRSSPGQAPSSPSTLRSAPSNMRGGSHVSSGVSAGLSSQKNRPAVRPEDVTAQVKRLAAKGKGSGEIWVSNTRYSGDGQPIDTPVSKPAAPPPTNSTTSRAVPDKEAPSGAGDYKIFTSAAPSKKSMPPRATSAPLYNALVNKKFQGTASSTLREAKPQFGASDPSSTSATTSYPNELAATNGVAAAGNGTVHHGSKAMPDDATPGASP